jgi:hypothetical protein
MSYYTQVLRRRVRQALTSILEGAHRARDLAVALRELASDLHLSLPAELQAEMAHEGLDVLRKRVRQALTSLLAVERANWSRELAMIFREIADELEPPAKNPGGDSE